MIKVNGTNVEASGSLEEVVAEYLYLTDAMANNASKEAGLSKDQWLDKIFSMVKSGIVETDEE